MELILKSTLTMTQNKPAKFDKDQTSRCSTGRVNAAAKFTVNNQPAAVWPQGQCRTASAESSHPFVSPRCQKSAGARSAAPFRVGRARSCKLDGTIIGGGGCCTGAKLRQRLLAGDDFGAVILPHIVQRIIMGVPVR